MGGIELKTLNRKAIHITFRNRARFRTRTDVGAGDPPIEQ
jgi:hypothetical protein